MKLQKTFVAAVSTLMTLGIGGAAAYFAVRDAGKGGIVGPVPPSSEERQEPSPAVSSVGFGSGVAYSEPDVAIHPDIARDFDIADITNVADMEKAYGFTFTSDELSRLAADKFVVKNLLDTSIRPGSSGDVLKEFVQL